MNLKKLHLYQFRNYQNVSLSFHDNGIHILSGKNAQGKTNIIEAIYFLAHLRSFRTPVLESLIQEGRDSFFIEGALKTQDRNEDLKVIVTDKKKHLYRFNKSIPTFSSFIGICNAILFSPDDMMIFNASPKDRRKFIDLELMKLSSSYTKDLSEYQKLLKSRNAALKQERIDFTLIDIFTEKMIRLQNQIITSRNAFIKELVENTREVYPFFSDKEEVMDIEYHTFVDLNRDLILQMEDFYKENKVKEKFTKVTSGGIHKDDITFLLNGKPVSQSASQGQKRSFLLALKLGLARMIKNTIGEYPILLLDDVFSELDENRQKQLLENLPEDMQIFITTTEIPNIKDYKQRFEIFYVENGEISKEEHSE